MAPPIGGFSIFDDKGEVKRLVEAVIQQRDPNVTIEQMRKIDFSYIFVLSKRDRTQEVELSREEIDASWGWRSGSVDVTLETKIQKAITTL